MYTDYGDFTAHTKHGDFEFYPSLKNMTNIGSPSGIIDIFSKVHMIQFYEWIKSGTHHNNDIATKAFNTAKNISFISSILVLKSCCSKDISNLVGEWKLNGSKITGKQGYEKSNDKIIALAKHLLFHGVVGRTENKKTSKGAKKSNEFKAAEYVAIARNKNTLGLSRDEAWSLTMTEFIMQMELIIPRETTDHGAPTDEQYDEVMNMIADIEKKRSE